ncbi:bactofilin family protein [Dankookia sp. P2]|uniref:bactofilin family protein n=1 Tax=Dankookia sp. P2 TaxID=3423955 RepID=UPI003D670D3B
MAIFGRKRDDRPATPAADPTPEAIPAAKDSDFGVPPFRPASKDAPNMLSGSKPNATPAAPNVGIRPAPVGVPARPTGRIDPGERRTLVVGRGISLQGTVADAERLVVEGTVESQMIQASELFVAQAGIFKGEVQVEDAEIAGLFDGTITARNSLVIRASGKVKRYRSLPEALRRGRRPGFRTHGDADRGPGLRHATPGDARPGDAGARRRLSLRPPPGNWRRVPTRARVTRCPIRRMRGHGAPPPIPAAAAASRLCRGGRPRSRRHADGAGKRPSEVWRRWHRLARRRRCSGSAPPHRPCRNPDSAGPTSALPWLSILPLGIPPAPPGCSAPGRTPYAAGWASPPYAGRKAMPRFGFMPGRPARSTSSSILPAMGFRSRMPRHGHRAPSSVPRPPRLSEIAGAQQARPIPAAIGPAASPASPDV